MSTEQSTETRYYVGRCDTCKARRGEYRVPSIITAGPYAGRMSGMVSARCECGDQMFLDMVSGTVTDKKCGARCRSAVRSSCECSCGGENHGRNWEA